MDTSLRLDAQSGTRTWDLWGGVNAGAELNVPLLNIDISKQDVIQGSFLIAHN